MARCRNLRQLSLLPLLYGLDIETDTAVDGLDPSVARIVAVALSTPDGDEVIGGPERSILRRLDHELRKAPPGVIVTWNGSGFDLPFLADRAARHRLRLGLRLHADQGIGQPHPPLRGHGAPYRARWHRHLHLDACTLYRGLLAPGQACGLKAVARSHGLEPVELDASSIHMARRGSLVDYVASDARLARLLAEMAWLSAGRVLDPVDLVDLVS
ncbi:MAG: hypothetical protein QOG03_2666 [Actinomycetota bacterium]|jgi:DNA polymerase elongation subunit (family B)|nr:hypothetical protein [Actinomycetota bacterium]